jgi:arylsulfatase A
MSPLRGWDSTELCKYQWPEAVARLVPGTPVCETSTQSTFQKSRELDCLITRSHPCASPPNPRRQLNPWPLNRSSCGNKMVRTTLVTFWLAYLSCGGWLGAARAAERLPNVVVFFVDNLGNGDIGCFGSKLHRTPHIDQLAAEGTRFTSFYVASGVCTPSRAALLTGCYPQRVSMHLSGAGLPVLRPVDTNGLHPDEMTIAEVLKSAGYATAIFGKWHLGDQPDFLPTRQGFVVFFGIPYSDDQTKDKQPAIWPELPLLRQETVIEAPVDRNFLVQRCTQEAISFIEQNRERPFFAYIPHTMPGSTSRPFSSPPFRGKSAHGDYGDAVEELDWSTGQITAALARLNLADHTLVIWTSDNGAVQRHPPQGSCAPYRGWGYDTSEGAMRMPCVMRFPGRIPAGRVCDEVVSTIDLLPTFARLAGADLPPRPIDGHDVRNLLFGKADAKSPWDEPGYMFYRMEQLQAVRSGPWKLYLPLSEKYITNNRHTAPAPIALFNVRTDVGETSENSAEYPAVVQRLTALAAMARKELGDTNLRGLGQRPAGYIAHPLPLVP